LPRSMAEGFKPKMPLIVNIEILLVANALFLLDELRQPRLPSSTVTTAPTGLNT